LYPKATAAEINAYLYHTYGGFDSLTHHKYQEQMTASVFRVGVDQPQPSKLWTCETYRFIGII
jgi:hypothetical protein